MTTQYETLRHEDTYREAFLAWSPRSAGRAAAVAAQAWLLHRAPGGGYGAAVARALCTCIVGTGTRTAGGEPSEGNAADDTAAPPPADRTRVLVPAQWGLVPHWVKSASDAKLRAPSWSRPSRIGVHRHGVS